MPKVYTTVRGDTFDLLALEFYNDEKLAGTIIQANIDHADTLIFDAGVQLTIPEASAVTMPETLPPWRRDT